MKLPEKRFEKLSELAKLLKKQEWELCQWAERGFFNCWIRINHRLTNLALFQGYAKIPEDQAGLFVCNEKLSLSDFIGEEGQVLSLPTSAILTFHKRIWSDFSPQHDVSEISVCRSELLIEVADINRMEADFPDLFSTDPAISKQVSGLRSDLSSGRSQSEEDDPGTEVKGWRLIAQYLKCSVTKAKSILIEIDGAGKESKRRWKSRAILQGGKADGGVWAWSKALDYVLKKPLGTAEKKKRAAEKREKDKQKAEQEFN